MSQQPPPLDYAQPNNAPAQRGTGRYLIWGLLIGSAVSAIAWIAGWDALLNHDTPVALFVIPGVKLAVAISLICLRGPQRRPARMFGVGVLLSIAAGFLIFFGSCFAHVAKSI